MNEHEMSLKIKTLEAQLANTQDRLYAAEQRIAELERDNADMVTKLRDALS